jgi:transposase
MSLHCSDETGIPRQTVEVARTAFPSGNVYMTLREELGTIFCDEQFQRLYPRRGQPAEAPWRLALITVLQFPEELTDRQAAEAVRSRIDWNYLLGLALNDPGFHYSVLSEFRMRLIGGGADHELFDTISVIYFANSIVLMLVSAAEPGANGHACGDGGRFAVSFVVGSGYTTSSSVQSRSGLLSRCRRSRILPLNDSM